MQPRLYDPSRPFQKPMKIITAPPNQKIRLLGDRTCAVRLMLHWVHKVSLPCVEGDCPYCHLDVRPYGYAPAVVATENSDGTYSWVQGILAVPFTSFDLIDEYNTKIEYEIGRKGNIPSGRLWWKKFRDHRGGSKDPFMVLPHLKRLWEKSIAKLAPIEVWRQFQGQDDRQNAA